MKISYKQKLSLWFFAIFVLFTIGIIVFERSRETKFKTEALIKRLDAYAEIIHASLEKHQTPNQSMEYLSGILPENLRQTLIDSYGNVIYDNVVVGNSLVGNHAERPEITQARTNGSGTNIRTSATNSQKYLYYAKRSNDYFIRVAFPYDVQIQNLLKSDRLFLYYIITLFIITLFVINYVADRFGKSIRKLKEFSLAQKNELGSTQFDFPEDELGEIGKNIIDNYEQLSKREKEIALEREKLLQHVYSSGEGLCFFSSNKKVEFYNGLFIQYLNTITDESASDPIAIFTDAVFCNIADFLNELDKKDNYYTTQIGRHGKHFNIQVNVFDDHSFEVSINDITKQEKTRLLKQEMTSNIAHELRTPVTSIRGYLEIALQQPLNEKCAHDFLTKAHDQTLVLSELIQDMSLITKIEEAPGSFLQMSVPIKELLDSLKSDLEISLNEKNICIEWKNMENVTVRGNRNLLYSIFRNLTDNAICYAGFGTTITVNKYNEDKDFYYFSYSDTGVGILGDHHLNRLFERFYRVNEGRTRDTGGSGLGLSIVKNAVMFHKGTIVAKNRAGGGLEFLFKLSK